MEKSGRSAPAGSGKSRCQASTEGLSRHKKPAKPWPVTGNWQCILGVGKGWQYVPSFPPPFMEETFFLQVMQTSPEHNHVGIEEVWWVWVSSHLLVVPSSSSLLHLFLSSTILECPILYSLLPCLSSLLLGSLIWAQDCAHCDNFNCQPDRIWYHYES